MMRFFLCIFLAAGTWIEGATVVSYVDNEGVTVLTNLETEPASFESERGLCNSGNFVPLISRVASRHGVDEELVQAIIEVESGFDPLAISAKNCKGLMQLHPDTARRFGVADIFDPAQNVEGGVKYLSYLIATFGEELDRVLAAYNAGENAVRRYNGIPPYPETIGYVKKVKALVGEGATERPHANNRIIRIELPDGRVLITNDPTQLTLPPPEAE